MRAETASCVADALLACERIGMALDGQTPESYESDWKLQSIVERQFLVVGEAIVRIRDLEPPIFDLLPESDGIIRFRNLLVHVYDRIDPKRVFGIAEEDVPTLTKTLRELMEDARKQGH